MQNFNWNKNEDSNEIIPKECFPNRIALTATGVVMQLDVNNEKQILLCNPHPDTWNTWMLPYGSLILDVKISENNLSLTALSEIIASNLKENFSNYEENAILQIRQLTGLKDADFSFKDNLTNYSLKFSQSANVWTAYCFMYHISNDGNKINPTCQTTWLNINDKIISELKVKGTLDGLKVAENVLPVLSEL